MKSFLMALMATTLLSCSKTSAQKLEYKEHITKEFATTKVLAVYNVNGSIKVESYAGSKIMIEADKKISGKTESILAEGKAEFTLAFDENQDTLTAYISAPWDSRPNHNKGRWNNDRQIHYDYHLAYTIKVPENTNLVLSTINNGGIEVANVTGFIKANNINGGIKIENAKNAHDVHSINGKVSVSFSQTPPDGARFYTLNGRMDITLPENFAADCDFKSFNGDFYTDFQNIENLPSKVTKTENKNSETIKYKLNQSQSIRFGAGGRNIKFETFNGNVYIKKSIKL